MESEQFMKLQEDIRKELARGNYQMDMNDLPYTGQARNVAIALWEKGWRPAGADSTLFREYRDKYESAYAILFGLHFKLTVMHNSFPIDSREREAFSEAVEVVKDRLDNTKRLVQHWEDEETKALEVEGYNE